MKKTQLETEIFQQPDAIENLINLENNAIRSIANRLKGKFHYVLIAARGTSDNAARYAQYLLGVHNHLQVALATPSLYSLYKSPPNLKGALVIGISQSGQSPDILSVIDNANRQGCPTISIVNDTGSPMAKMSNDVIPMHAFPEKSIAATKSYTASLTAVALLSSHLSGEEKLIHALRKIPAGIRTTFKLLENDISGVERYSYIQNCVVIGRGFNYATAFEISLKIKELSKVSTEPYSSADFRHGPIATVHKGYPVMLITPKGKTYNDMRDLALLIKEKDGELIIISDDKSILKLANFPLHLAESTPEWLSPLVAVIPGQLFALKLTTAKHLDPDLPKGLTKVTQTL